MIIGGPHPIPFIEHQLDELRFAIGQPDADLYYIRFRVGEIDEHIAAHERARLLSIKNKNGVTIQ